MSKRGKAVNEHKQKPKHETAEESNAQNSSTGPGIKPRSWAAVQKLPGGGKNMEARRKLPSGQLGGSGRKTNVSRSS